MDAPLYPATGKTVAWLLRAHTERRPDSTFLHWAPFDGPDRTYSYAEFHALAARVANGLAARGVGKGTRVLLHADNCPEFLLVWHACAMLGAVIVTTNPRAAAAELEYFVEHSGVSVGVTQPAYAALLERSRHRLAWLAVIDDGSGASEIAPTEGLLPFTALIADEATPPASSVAPLDPLSIQYTSGTTSRPKGVVWTHANALWAGQVGTAHNGLDETDTALVFTPLCHTNAMSWGHLAVLWSGGAFVLQPRFSVTRFWPVAVRYGCTWANVISFAAQALTSQASPAAHRFRHWVVGAANTGALELHHGVPFVGAWGMTETVTHATYTPTYLPSPRRSMGMPTPEYQVGVFAPDGRPVGIGDAGVLKVRGRRGVSLFLEYLNDAAATAAAFDADGWFDTGDRVRLIEDGHLLFLDRVKDMLKVGAENVAASEVEAVIATVPGVRESAVVGKPDPLRTEVPVAFVRADAPDSALADAIVAACVDRLAGFKVPVEVFFVDDFPRAELNKISKKLLRERLTRPDP